MWDCVGECLRLKFENTSHCQVCQLVVGLVPIFQFSCLSVWSWFWKIRFLEWRLHSIVKCVTLVVDFAGVSRYQGISVLLSFCISDFVRLDFKTEDYIPSSSVSASDIRNSPPSLRGIRLYHQGLSVYTYIHHCHLIIVIVFCIVIIVIANCHLVNSHLRGHKRKENNQLGCEWEMNASFLLKKRKERKFNNCRKLPSKRFNSFSCWKRPLTLLPILCHRFRATNRLSYFWLKYNPNILGKSSMTTFSQEMTPSLLSVTETKNFCFGGWRLPWVFCQYYQKKEIGPKSEQWVFSILSLSFYHYS